MEVDAIAKRYGVLPSEVLKVPLPDYQFDLLVASNATAQEAKEAEKLNKAQQLRRHGRVR